VFDLDDRVSQRQALPEGHLQHPRAGGCEPIWALFEGNRLGVGDEPFEVSRGDTEIGEDRGNPRAGRQQNTPRRRYSGPVAGAPSRCYHMRAASMTAVAASLKPSDTLISIAPLADTECLGNEGSRTL
jgi:hypothetical protein